MAAPPTSYRPYLLMLLLFVVVLAGTVFFLRRPEPVPLAIITLVPSATPTPASVLVDVRGAVANPGVYSLPAGSRLLDALTLAGAPLPDADTRRLNLARRVNDGEQIYVPTFAEATLMPVATAVKSERQPSPTRTPFGKININTATLDDLDLLPGIGPGLGQRILDYRTQNGPFTAIEDLKKVRGIGDVVFTQIKDLVTVQ